MDNGKGGDGDVNVDTQWLCYKPPDDDDDDYDKATTVAQTAPEPRWAKMSLEPPLLVVEVEVIVVAASWCFVEEIILCWDGNLK